MIKRKNFSGRMIADSFFFVNLFDLKKCIINQKEVNKGTDSISLKLKNYLKILIVVREA